MIEAIMPWRSDGIHREQARRWVTKRYADLGWGVTLAPLPSGPWSKGAALVDVVKQSTADIIVVADADVWSAGLVEAVEQVEAGAPWAIPHLLVHRLTREGTAAVFAGARWLDQPTTQPPYAGVLGGGLVVAPRAVVEAIPIDPRFEGWGQEDEAWALALYVLTGEPWRGTAPLVHLWHEAQERISRRRGSVAGWELRRRYLKCRDEPSAMRALIEEAHAHFRTADANLHDHPPRVVGNH